MERTKTFNIAADMITGCLAHYKKYGKQVESILLSHKFWDIFLRHLAINAPEHEAAAYTAGAIQFKNVLIKKGSHFQNENLVPELKKETVNNA